MRKVSYIRQFDRQLWEDIWRPIGVDPDEVDPTTYPLYPTVNHIKNDGTILECGCGPGRVVNYYYNKKYDIVGLDYSMVAVSNLKKAKPESKLICGDALCLPFANETFKYFCAYGVYGSFENKSDRDQFLKEARRVLKKDGLLILSVSAHNTLYYINYGIKQNNFIRLLFGKKPIPHHFAWYQFRQEEISKEIEESGFNVKEVTYVKTNQFFYDLFPYFRKKQEGFDRKDTVKLERGGENVYPLNKAGKAVFAFVDKYFHKAISTAMVTVSVKKNV